MASKKESFNNLKKTARTLDDVANWFSKNLDVLGDLPAHKENTVRVRVEDFNSVICLLEKEQKEHVFKVHLSVEMMVDALPKSSFFNDEKFSPLRVPTELCFCSDYVMHFDEWALPVAEVAFDYIANEGYPDNIEPTWTNVSENLINTYLPKHFPGLDLAKLKSIAALDLFPKDLTANTSLNKLQLDHKGFLDVLFASQMVANESYRSDALLPNDMNI